jgi:hypothetical protein
VLIDLTPVKAGKLHVELRGCLPGDLTGLGNYPGIHTLSTSINRRGKAEP